MVDNGGSGKAELQKVTIVSNSSQMTEAETVVENALRRLTGEQTIEKSLISSAVCQRTAELLLSHDGSIGHSQFNELLLAFGCDRVAGAFFAFLADSKSDASEHHIRTIRELTEGVSRFVVLAIRTFGNVKYAYKVLARNSKALKIVVALHAPKQPSQFTRHLPLYPIEKIEGAETYLLGYISGKMLNQDILSTPDSLALIAMKERRQEVIAIGKRNHEAYLLSDHMDVYVATSMRKRHEYLEVAELTSKIFHHPTLNDLNLRWFDPTQSYCVDRIDKGLVEALMLKRAVCTLYLAQESDTLGKDSELASTLAQGKSVLAYVPIADDRYINDLLERLAKSYPDKPSQVLILEQLQLYTPEAAWNASDSELREWLNEPSAASTTDLLNRLKRTAKKHFDDRAELLRKDHPLGIQVHLETGVANGVLVVRTIEECAALLRSVVLCDLDLAVSERHERIDEEDRHYLELREKISECVYRVATGDRLLTNAFWNFYLGTDDASQTVDAL